MSNIVRQGHTSKFTGEERNAYEKKFVSSLSWDQLTGEKLV